MMGWSARRAACLPLFVIGGLAALGGCIEASAEQPSAAGPKAITISVLATNDVHGRLSQLPLFGGYARNLRAARAADGGGVLLLDAGDMFQGTLASCLSEGASMIRGYRALGYAAAAVGNHEFDFGPVGPAPIPHLPDDDPFGALCARMGEASFPMLCANLRARDGSAAPLPGLRASLMTEVAGVRVGIVGGLTVAALTATHGANVTGLSMEPLAPSIEREARSLRSQGARLVIALVHAGGDCVRVDNPDDTSSCDAGSEVFALARELAAADGGDPSKPKLVDLIVGGHTHAMVAHRVAGIPIIESGANGHAFGRVDFKLSPGGTTKPTYQIHRPHDLCLDHLDAPVCARERYEGAPVERDPRVLAAITGDLAQAKLVADQPIGVEVSSPLARSSDVESPLTNLVVDLMLRANPSAQAAFNNPGSVRIALPVGPLTYGRVFEMFPFENRFARLRMLASDLAKVVQNSLQSDRGLVTLAGVRASARCRNGTLDVTLTSPNGKTLPPARKLTVITSDYVAATGDGLMRGIRLPANDITIQPEPFVREALITGLQSYSPRKLNGADPSIYDAKKPRIRFVGPRPVVCPPGPTPPTERGARSLTPNAKLVTGALTPPPARP